MGCASSKHHQNVLQAQDHRSFDRCNITLRMHRRRKQGQNQKQKRHQKHIVFKKEHLLVSDRDIALAERKPLKCQSLDSNSAVPVIKRLKGLPLSHESGAQRRSKERPERRNHPHHRHPAGLEEKEKQKNFRSVLDELELEKKCPPGGAEAVVVYTTSLRGIRKTFEECRRVVSILEGLGVAVDQRDVAMHSQFKNEVRDLMGPTRMSLPSVFIKGRYVGGAAEVIQLNEDGCLRQCVEGVRLRLAAPCDGCGGMRFVPCLSCRGSRKIFSPQQGDDVITCGLCNENGLVLCPLCDPVS